MHPDGTAADREGERSGGDDAAASRPGPSTSPLLLVFEVAECSNTGRTNRITCSSNSSSNNRTSRSTRTANGHLHSSLPLKNSLSKNCRLLKSGPVVLLHCNVNGTKRTAAAAISSSSTVDESAEDQQRRRQPPTPPSSFFGQEPRRRQTKRSTTDQHVRRRLLLITSVISCASLLLFTLITSLIFIRRPFDDATTSTDLNDESGGNDQQLIKKLRGAYSEMSPYSSENAQIWLLNRHEFRRQRRQRRHDKHGEANDQFLFGLARNCGQFCTVRLKHGVVGKSGGQLQQMESLRIRLERRRQWTVADDDSGARRRRSPNQRQHVDDFRPIVQTMELDNQTMFRHSHVSSKCFYTARVAEHLEQSVVNLCDRNGGLFGTLALVEGAFVIEPLVDIEQEQEGEMVNGRSGEQLHNVGVRKRKRHLTAEFASDLRAHHVYRLQPHHFDDFRKRTATAAEAEEAKLGTEHHQQRSASTLNDDHQGFRSAKSVPPWLNRLPLLSADTDHEDGMSVPYQRLQQRPTRSANSWEHFVEVLVVADYKMLLYHQHNLENYVLTLFSTVSYIYRHSSLGAAINVIVVRLVVLKNERAGPDVSNRAQETLQQFCQWQHTLNDRNDDALNHHDVAILLTRHDICRTPNKCDTLGLAELGTMCDGRKSCAIIEDNGLSAAFTIAHELGHVFNIPHDDDRKCAEFMPLNKHSYRIMAPTLGYNSNPWSWSSCSSAMLLRFLDHQRAQTQCLFDKPTERRYYEKMFEMPAPGAVYTVSQQCKFVFGAAAKICPYMPTCRRLWCSVSYGYQMGCRTQHMPWADATPCGDNMWCHRGQCVGMSPMQRQPIGGAWGEWKPWRECSRTCGGGVQKAFRECDSPRPENGGKYCVGQRERYRPCNVQDCHWSMPGFRELQCTEFDGTNIGIHGVPKEMKWLPKYTGVADNERCRLYCRGADSAAFYLLKDKVVDGTTCDRNGDDICIDGTCHKAGCDHRLGSEIKRDICGVCGGNGSICRAVNGLYNKRSTFGYNDVLRIPAGAAGIDITQTAHNGQKEDDNYLALCTFTGEFLLNGQYQVSVFRQQIPILGTVLEYSGSDQAVERINGTGPLRSDIYLHVLSVGNLNRPNIRYHFMTPIAASAASAAPATAAATATGASSFYWRTENNWTECTLKCQGEQGQHVRCADSFTNRPVAEAHCAGIQRPGMQKRLCNVDCFYKYLQRLNTDSAGRKWYQCICVRSYTNEKEEQALESECQAAGLKAPVLSAGGTANAAGTNAQHHYHHKSPPAAAVSVPSTEHRQQQQKLMAYSPLQHRLTALWAYSQWSQCSETCGSGGLSRRSLHCIDTRNGQKLDARFCEGVPHEPVETECNRTPCPRWAYTQWYQCSRSCGGGLRMRHASCQDATGRELHAQMCTGEVKMDSEKCNEQPCTQWRFGPWSPCSVSCGNGVQRREGVCVCATDAQPVEESRCEPRERILEKQCQRAACPYWKLGSWSQCSASCGQDGFQMRLVQCVDSAERKIADQQCHGKEQQQKEKPQSYKVCSPGPCPYWAAIVLTEGT